MDFKHIFDFSKNPYFVISEEIAIHLILLKKLKILENKVTK